MANLTRWAGSLTCAALTLACPAPESTLGQAPTDTVAPVLPACSETGVITSVNPSGDLPSTGGTLPVTLGFQGFQFAQLGLRAPVALSSPTTVRTRVTVPGKMSTSATYARVRLTSGGSNLATVPLLVFFNDVPLAELYGQPATITLEASTGTCWVAATVTVTLGQGGFADADATLWADGGAR